MSTESGAWVGVENNTVVNVKAQLGYTAFLPCSVRMIGDKQVSTTNVSVATFSYVPTRRFYEGLLILWYVLLEKLARNNTIAINIRKNTTYTHDAYVHSHIHKHIYTHKYIYINTYTRNDA